ncbi:WD40-repeat-containing domain protein [Blyttiomyces helicus]|uniref:WD40-repeat-containing domain protein n=1 Tax=Blyttiomyces helicus TaxID=388810 RepID=A0A4P9W0S1_9FUNG|nr:WD40-repeat-containing domain protein [Blyttiomyces helicus]|eukprot:RKO83636.1 WD40-repeat-containing domain protein [Blyttiomyces helicus]
MLKLEQHPGTGPPRSVFVGEAKSGPIWKSSEWRRIVGGIFTKGTLLRVCDSSAIVRRPTAAEPTARRTVAISCFCFSHELAPHVEHHNPAAKTSSSFWLVARIGVSGTCIAFNVVRRRELIVGMSDNSLHCYNIDTCQLIAKLPSYHNSEPQHISVHPHAALAISCARSEAILWDTEVWERKRLLLGSPSAIQQATFSPNGETIITSFADGNIIVWTTESFTMQWKITLEQLAGSLDEVAADAARLLSAPRVAYFALSRSGELLVYAGL